MTILSKQTAMDIAMAYREIEVGDRLLSEVREATKPNGWPVDIRDAFGRIQHGLQLGVPSGDNSTRLFNVPYQLAVPIIEAHIAQHRAVLAALTEKARAEIAEPEKAPLNSETPQPPQGKVP